MSNNDAAIRIQKYFATDPVHGNCIRKQRLHNEGKNPKIDETPLPKRKQSKK